MDDALQLAAISDGDHRVFAHWMAGSEERIRLSLSSWATTIDVEVVVQETLLRAWQVAPRLEPHLQGETLLRYCIRIARNLAIDLGRRARTIPTDPPALERLMEAAVGAAAPPTSEPGLRAVLQDCVERLPKAPRRVLGLRLGGQGGQSDRDLAALAEMQLNTFLKNFGRARTLLKACLDRAGIALEEVRR
ncbi:MAG: DNA-directed RNA polymerase specialized sigma24 family protein [Myxococcota bacterium]|jgi:DNA-directed RNA polymerase specialized sigma24 family protein